MTPLSAEKIEDIARGIPTCPIADFGTRSPQFVLVADLVRAAMARRLGQLPLPAHSTAKSAMSRS